MFTSNNELVIYLLVRKDLKMGKGKIGAQCGHAIQDLIIKAPKQLLALYTSNGSSPKICLAVKDSDEMDSIRDQCSKRGILYHRVIDAGKTQVEPGTNTVLGIGPVSRKLVQDIMTKLKLL